MALINHALRRLYAKIVYCGPGLCGKTTNLQYIYDHTASSHGELVSLETETDRTLLLDLLPLEAGLVGGYQATIQLFTVPGITFYGEQRKLVLTGADGLVFVADSQTPMARANRDSLEAVREHLAQHGRQLDAMPAVLQCNKRDLPDIMPVAEMQESLGCSGWPCYEASALEGTGVFETLVAVLDITLRRLEEVLHAPSPAGAAQTSTWRVIAPESDEWNSVPTWLAAEPGNPFDGFAGL
jgi:mutual gliding-motility protein MglA